MSTSDSVAMRTWPMACVPVNDDRPYWSCTGLRVAEVLDDLQGAAEREHLASGDVLHEVGEQLEVSVVREGDAEGVGRLLLDLVDASAERGQAGLDLDAVTPSRSANSKSRGVFASASL